MQGTRRRGLLHPDQQTKAECQTACAHSSFEEAAGTVASVLTRRDAAGDQTGIPAGSQDSHYAVRLLSPGCAVFNKRWYKVFCEGAEQGSSSCRPGCTHRRQPREPVEEGTARDGDSMLTLMTGSACIIMHNVADAQLPLCTRSSEPQQSRAALPSHEALADPITVRHDNKLEEDERSHSAPQSSVQAEVRLSTGKPATCRILSSICSRQQNLYHRSQITL